MPKPGEDDKTIDALEQLRRAAGQKPPARLRNDPEDPAPTDDAKAGVPPARAQVPSPPPPPPASAPAKTPTHPRVSPPPAPSRPPTPDKPVHPTVPSAKPGEKCLPYNLSPAPAPPAPQTARPPSAPPSPRGPRPPESGPARVGGGDRRTKEDDERIHPFDFDAPAQDLPPAAPPRSPSTPAFGRRAESKPATSDAPPAYRCLNCGYPMPEEGNLTCSECGRSYERQTMEWWFEGEEQKRFEQVNWLMLAILFSRLLLLPQLLSLGRVAGAVAICAAGAIAYRGKRDSVGGYYAVGAIVLGGLMFVAFAWSEVPTAYYTLDMIAACVLLLSLLHDPVGGRVASATLGRQIAPILLFCAPVVGTAFWWLNEQFGATLAPGSAPPALPGMPAPTPGGRYALFGFLGPLVASSAVWIFVWRSLAEVRRTLFAPLEGEA